MSRIERDLVKQLDQISPIKRTEIESHLALFRRFDTDGDHRLSKEEYENLWESLPSDIKSQKSHKFPDLDGNEYVSVLEFLSYIR